MTTTSSTADLGAFTGAAQPAPQRYERAAVVPAAVVVPTGSIPAAPPPRTRSGTWAHRAIQRARSAPISLWLAWGVLALVALWAVAPSTFTSYSATVGVAGQQLQAPSAAHWLGTDALGRDVYSRIVYGIQTSLLVGVTAQVLLLVIGVGLGGLAGMRGGKVDFAIMRLVDVMASFPQLLFTILLMATLGVGFFPACWRTLRHRASCTRCQTPSRRQRQKIVYTVFHFGKSCGNCRH